MAMSAPHVSPSGGAPGPRELRRTAALTLQVIPPRSLTLRDSPRLHQRSTLYSWHRHSPVLSTALLSTASIASLVFIGAP